MPIEPAAARADAPPHAHAKARTLVALACAYFVAGAAAAATENALHIAEIGMMIATAVASGFWFYFDARERGVRTTKWERHWIVIFPLIFVPRYLIRTRGWRAVISLSLLLLYTVALGVALAAGVFVVLQLRG